MKYRWWPVLGALVLFLPLRARGEGGAWLQLEYRQPVLNRPDLPRLAVRAISDTRLGSDRGLTQQFLRVGPWAQLTDWMILAVNGTIYADHLADDRFAQEARIEIEPTFQGRVGPIFFADRNRVESRWRGDTVRGRYRNQLRLSWAPLGSRIQPFVWNEILCDLQAGCTENRLQPGVAFKLAPHIRLDVGYLMRSRAREDGWQHDHYGLVYLLVDLPEPKRPGR
jgi:hypothetical protein